MGENTVSVTWEAEQVTETHRTLEADHTVTEVELPGSFNVYCVIDGGRLLFTQFKAGKVLDAIEAAKSAQAEQAAQDAAAQETVTAPDSGPQGDQAATPAQSPA